jgi:formylmethanofuran dehydrogenase subunit E
MPNVAIGLPLHQRPFDDLLDEAVRFHGDECPGQVLGVRMACAGCRDVGIDDPRTAGKSLIVFVEVDRCAVDAIQALTGVSLGKRTMKFLDYGKAAATFVNTVTGGSVRVAARESARARAVQLMPAEPDARRAMIAAYRVMDEDALLDIAPVTIAPGWLDRPRVRVACAHCGEGVNYRREVVVDGRALCHACARPAYYAYDPGHNVATSRAAMMGASATTIA